MLGGTASIPNSGGSSKRKPLEKARRTEYSPGGADMKCPGCQHDNPPDLEVCVSCGARLTPVCGACGTHPSPGASFCPQCGTPLQTARTSGQIGERTVTSRGSLEIERKLVTVLFADLKGSMDLLAHRDPEDAREILDPVIQRMIDAVHRYEGTGPLPS